MDGVNFNLHTNDLYRTFVRLNHLHKVYASHLHSNTWNVATQSLQYLQGKFLDKGRGDVTNTPETCQTAERWSGWWHNEVTDASFSQFQRRSAI